MRNSYSKIVTCLCFMFITVPFVSCGGDDNEIEETIDDVQSNTAKTMAFINGHTFWCMSSDGFTKISYSFRAKDSDSGYWTLVLTDKNGNDYADGVFTVMDNAVYLFNEDRKPIRMFGFSGGKLRDSVYVYTRE